MQRIQMCLQVRSDLMSLALEAWQCRSQKYEAHVENPVEYCCSMYADEQLRVSNHGVFKTKRQPFL